MDESILNLNKKEINKKNYIGENRYKYFSEFWINVSSYKYIKIIYYRK